jgi:hypothetical protein
VVALLVIAPSKTDRERVIPMSAELFHVIAEIIRYHTRNGGSIPLAVAGTATSASTARPCLSCSNTRSACFARASPAPGR